MLQATRGKVDSPGQFLDRVIAGDVSPYDSYDTFNPRIEPWWARFDPQCLFSSEIEIVEA
ncbi:hypothetical protein [Bradyrhizobium sp. SZCCHNR2028]|uniref:hypothetical protein n=1 Tax=Bradyrhizobium sp. SZCCHNR2028 TaxID=3057382 RepID=UPI0028EF0C86|nr:hypothetical protein [Bradyrhizobium sp. SZCCHNR2028]